MMNTMRRASRLSAISGLAIKSQLSLFNPRPNLFIILTFTFHTSNKPTLNQTRPYYKIEDVTNLDDAVTLFNQMLEAHTTPIYLFTKLLNILVKMKHYSHVIFMFKKMTLSGFTVDEYIMSTVINCYCKSHQVELCFGVIAFFLKRGYAPNIVSFTCIIDGFFLKRNVFEAVGFFKKTVRDKLCDVNEFAVSTVLDGLVKSRNVFKAVELLEISEKNNWRVNVFCYSIVLNGLCRARMLKDAMRLLVRMIDRGIFPDVVTFTTVIDGFCKAGMVKDGMDLLFRMIDEGVVPNVVTYTSFLHGLCNHNQLDLARNLFNDLPSKGICPNVITYNVMIQGLCGRGLFKDAKETVDKMEVDGCFPNGITYNIIIQACLHHRDSFDSINLLKHIVGRDFKLDSPSFFVLLGQIQRIRQMQGTYDDDVINRLILKLISSDAIYQIHERKDELLVSKLIQKLYSSGSR